MKALFTKFRDITISGILALLPLYVFLLVINKAWKSLSSIGTGVAQMLGLKSILGVGGATILSAILIVFIWLVTGFLVRYSFLASVTKAAERQLSKYVPDYDKYKARAEERLQNKVKVIPYASALIRWEDYWQPGYIVEQDEFGGCVVFLPDIPETNKGHVLLVRQDQVRIVDSVTANQLDESLKKIGKGLLNNYGIRIPPTRRPSSENSPGWPTRT